MLALIYQVALGILFMNHPIFTGALVLLITASSLTHAAPRIDYDIDNDGLIEIEDLQDLNEIRNNVTEMNYSGEVDGIISLELHGDALYGSNDGCPEDGCAGYELVRDLNFDTNLNEQFDAGDTYWNEGKGWQSIGSFFIKFVAEFHGNGFTIHNLNINRPQQQFLGLFAYADMASFHDLSLTGQLTTGADSGAIVGYAWKTVFKNLFIDVIIEGKNGNPDCSLNCDANQVGGLAGSVDDSKISQLVIKANITGNNYLGGLAGLIQESEIKEVAIQSSITGNNFLGGLSGFVTSSQINSITSFTHVSGHGAVGGVMGASKLSNIKNVLISGAVTPGLGIGRFARGGGFSGSVHTDQVSHIISLVELPADSEDRHLIGALIGDAVDPDINNTYWAADLTLRERMYSRAYNLGISQRYDLIDLQCASPTENCNGLKYDQFSNQHNDNQQTLWHFGGNNEAPTMKLAMGEFGDKDADGVAENWPVIEGPSAINNPEPVPEVSDSTNSGSGPIWVLLFMLPLFTRRPHP